MKRALCLGLGLCLMAVPAVWAQERAAAGADLTDPIEILKKADAATKTIKAVRYHGRVEAEGISTRGTPNIEGTLLFEGPFKEMWPSKFRYECKVTKPGSTETREITVGYDGTNFYVVNPTSKTVYQDTVPTVLGGFGLAVVRSFPMIEFVHQTPFDDEIKGDKAELQGAEKVGDQECYKVYVQYAKSQGEAIWYFSKKDFLPRRVDRLNKDAAGQTGVARYWVTELKVNPELTPDAFTVVVPEGYSTSKQGAP